MKDLPLAIVAEIDAIACFDNDMEVMKSVKEIGDSNPKETNGSKEASKLHSKLDHRMRPDRAGRSLSQHNLLNSWKNICAAAVVC